MKTKALVTLGAAMLFLLAGAVTSFATKCNCEEDGMCPDPPAAGSAEGDVWVVYAKLNNVLQCAAAEELGEDSVCVNDKLVPCWYSESYADDNCSEYIVGSGAYGNYLAGCGESY